MTSLTEATLVEECLLGQELAKMFYFFAEKKSRRVMLGFDLTFYHFSLQVFQGFLTHQRFVYISS